MLTGIASHRIRRDITDPSPITRVIPLLQTSTLPEVEGIAAISADRSNLISGLQITDQRLLLNQFQVLNRRIQELIRRQPTFNQLIEQQLAQTFGTTPPVDPASLYVHHYATDEHGQRRLLSVQTITQALFNTLLKLKTPSAADAANEGTESGFYLGTAPADSDQQLNAHGTLLSIAQTVEKALPLSLARFWTEPRLGEANPESPQTELLAIHREMLSTLAALQVEDGTLTPAAKTLIDNAFAYPTLAERERAMKDGERPGVYPLKLDTPRPDGSLLAGSFLLTSSDGSSMVRPFNSPSTDRTLTPGDQRGLTVLYTPRDGYEVFDSPTKALQTLRQRINDYPDAAQQLLQSLPLATQRSLKPDWKNALRQNLTPLTTDVIAAGVPQLLERQRQQVSTELQALYEPQSNAISDDPWRAPQILESLEQASDLGPHFDGANALSARTERLLDRLSTLDAGQVLIRQLENRKNWQSLAQQLNQASQSLAENASTRDVSAALKKAPMNVAPGSAHYQQYILDPGNSVSLEAFIRETGLPLPKTRNELLALAQTAAARAQQHPFGNFGGALSWPVPLSLSKQQVLRDAATDLAAQQLDSSPQSPALGVLEYLSRRQSLSGATQEDPVKVLEALVSSPDGRALGLAMQTKMNGIATDHSLNDYTLAAINLALDPESLAAPRRNWVAGFDLADKKHWGNPLSAVVEGLSQHLIDQQRASPQLAKTCAYLLLMRAAPQFLVKNIPQTVVYGSVAWANLCIAVAAIEAQSPGRVAHMTFAEVMITATRLGAAPASAQAAVMLDWAVAKNVLVAKDDTHYTQDDIDKAQAKFNDQQEKLQAVSSLLDTPVPDRSQMAEALLKKEFGENVSLDDPIFAKKPQGLPPKPGKPYSMRDIVMEGVVMDDRWGIKEGVQGVDFNTFVAFTKRPEFNIKKTFDDEYSIATAHRKTVKTLSIANALSNLPPEDQKILSHAKLSYYQEKSYKIGTLGNTLFHTSPKILVCAENSGTFSKYEFDTEKGALNKLGHTAVSTKPEKFHNEITQLEEFFPDVSKGKAVDGLWTFASFIPGFSNIQWADKDSFKRNPLDNAQPADTAEPYLITHPRFVHIAESVVKALDLDNPTLKKAAAGTTSSEHRSEQTGTLRNFFLDLIPFRSAIVNFIEGNYSEGITDVAFDIFGFITAGVGAAAKATKVLGQAGSTLSKALKVTKIMVPALLKELNPFDGAGDLILGAGKVAYEGGSAARNGLRTLKGTANRDALLAASKHYDAAATGSIKVGDTSIIGSAAKHNNQWYAFDADSLQPYGPPLVDFNPIDTLMPAAARSHTPTSHRARPYPSRPPHPHVGATKEPLPAGDYVEQTEGKLVPGHFIPGDGLEQTAAHFTQKMEEYHAAAKVPGTLPAQPIIPPVPKPISPQQLITETLKVSQGLVFGEHHSQMASFKLLMDSIPTFKAQGVKRVYFEGMIDLPGVGAVDDGIGNLGNLKKGRTNPTLQELIDEFRKNGIEVLPLDHYYLTRHKHDLVRSRTVSGVNSEIRLKEFNYYAAETILATSGNEKWIALVGNAHMNTSEGVTGLAELTGTLGIGVFDNANVPASIGFIDTRHIPDPTKPLKRGDLPGNLHIYIKP